MNVALATAAASKPPGFMAARNGETVDQGAGTRTLSTARETDGKRADDKEDPLVGRYPIIAFSYDTDASRLVMLFRDPADGSTVSQIPTEAALKQYKEAQREKKDRRSSLELVVGGAGEGETGSWVLPPAGRSQGADRSVGSAAPSPQAASPAASAVAFSSATTSSAAPPPGPATGTSGSAPVNVVV